MPDKIVLYIGKYGNRTGLKVLQSPVIVVSKRRAWPSGYGARLACRKSRVRLPPGAHVRTIFTDPIDQDIRTQWALSWKIVVSEWRSSGVASALSNWQNCACACKTLQTQRGRTHGAGCVRQWFRTAEPLGERCYENWNTHTSHCC